MRLRIEPQPTPQEAEAIAAAIEPLLAPSTRAGATLRFNDAALVRRDYADIRHAGLGRGDDTYRGDYTWRALARIEALKPGV